MPSAGLSGFQEFFPLLSSNLPGTWSIASSPLSANLVQVAKDVPAGAADQGLLCPPHIRVLGGLGTGGAQPGVQPRAQRTSLLPKPPALLPPSPGRAPPCPPSSLFSPALWPDRSLKGLGTQLPSSSPASASTILSVSSSSGSGPPSAPALCFTSLMNQQKPLLWVKGHGLHRLGSRHLSSLAFGGCVCGGLCLWQEYSPREQIRPGCLPRK